MGFEEVSFAEREPEGEVRFAYAFAMRISTGSPSSVPSCV
jgi:hypothetical protein